jgi:hypothetical protein
MNRNKDAMAKIKLTKTVYINADDSGDRGKLFKLLRGEIEAIVGDQYSALPLWDKQRFNITPSIVK